MNVAAAQIACIPGDIGHNCRVIAHYVNDAAARGCRLVVVPEMADTGYDMSIIDTAALPWDGPGFAAVRDAAAHSRINVICGLSQRSDGGVFNAAAVIDAGGRLLASYRKTHLFSADPVNEDRHLRAGDALVTVMIDDMRIGLLICYDLRFPEVSRRLAIDGAEMLVVCSAWPRERRAHFTLLAAARAVENQCFLVAANRVGTDGGLTFCGASRVIDPQGTVLACASDDDQELVVAECRREQVAETRGAIPVFANRRPDLY